MSSSFNGNEGQLFVVTRYTQVLLTQWNLDWVVNLSSTGSGVC